MKLGSITGKSSDAFLSLDELIRRYQLSNRAEGKSPKTLAWYTDIFQQYSTYCKKQVESGETVRLSIDHIRKYILYLRNKPKYKGHPYTPEQVKPLSPK